MKKIRFTLVTITLLLLSHLLQAQNKIEFSKNIYDFGTFEMGITGEVSFVYNNLSKRQAFEIVEISSSRTVKVREDYKRLIKPQEAQTIYVLAKGGDKLGPFEESMTIYYINKKKNDRKKKKGKDVNDIKKVSKIAILKIKGNISAY